MGGISACIVMIPSVIAYRISPVCHRLWAFTGRLQMLGYAAFASLPQVIVGPAAAILS